VAAECLKLWKTEYNASEDFSYTVQFFTPEFSYSRCSHPNANHL